VTIIFSFNNVVLLVADCLPKTYKKAQLTLGKRATAYGDLFLPSHRCLKPPS